MNAIRYKMLIPLYSWASLPMLSLQKADEYRFPGSPEMHIYRAMLILAM